MEKLKNNGCSRRMVLKSAVTGFALFIAKTTGFYRLNAQASRIGAAHQPFLIEGISTRDDASSHHLLVKKVFEAAGGINRFIPPGSTVAIKPNISWARRPEYAATTNPEVLRSLVELCIDAGAKKVVIADNTIHDANRCFSLTGVSAVAKYTGAELIYPRPGIIREAEISGVRIKAWPVLTPFLEADVIINVPVLKHHSLTGITGAMKNWIGAVGGSRWVLHQDIHQSIVDLAGFFRPAVTLVDATRILTRNGPSGGDLKAVTRLNRVILSNDQVAADARAAVLFGRIPGEIHYIRLAAEEGLGTMQIPDDMIKTVTL